MNTKLKKYATQFYGRTWMVWACVLLLGPLVAIWFVMGIVFLLGIGEPPNGDSALVGGITMMIVALLALPFVIESFFLVLARQRPILKIYREGIWIRFLGAEPPLRLETKGLIQEALLHHVAPLIFLITYPVKIWQLLTLKTFQTRIVYLHWEYIEPSNSTQAFYTISGWAKVKNNDFEQDVPMKYLTTSYEGDSFGTALRKVVETIEFFWRNPDTRETLPSWQDEELLIHNDTFGFDKQ